MVLPLRDALFIYSPGEEMPETVSFSNYPSLLALTKQWTNDMPVSEIST